MAVPGSLAVASGGSTNPVAMPTTYPAHMRTIVLVIFYVFTLAAIAGYAVFGRHPQLLERFPDAREFYSTAFTFFARAHVIAGFAVLATVLIGAARARWVLAFIAVYVASLASELLGTTVGLPFGPYSYTDGLGIKWFAHVPVLIPMSWFTMALPSFALALRLGASIRSAIVVGAIILLSWDLALDPAMSRVTTYWLWGGDGPYYGMPWLNLLGWFVTGLVLMAILARLRAAEWSAAVPTRWLVAFYGANLLLPLGLNAAAGFWLANVVTMAALALTAVVTLVRTDRGIRA